MVDPISFLLNQKLGGVFTLDMRGSVAHVTLIVNLVIGSHVTCGSHFKEVLLVSLARNWRLLEVSATVWVI